MALTLSDIADVAMAIAAVYGAGLSTYLWIVQLRERRPSLEVRASTGLLAWGPEVSPAMLLLEVVNTGALPVTVQPPGLRLPDRRQLVFPQLDSNVRFPHELPPRNSCTAWVPVSLVAQKLHAEGYSGRVKLVPFCRDATGKRYIGKALQLRVEEWLQEG